MAENLKWFTLWICFVQCFPGMLSCHIVTRACYRTLPESSMNQFSRYKDWRFSWEGFLPTSSNLLYYLEVGKSLLIPDAFLILDIKALANCLSGNQFHQRTIQPHCLISYHKQYHNFCLRLLILQHLKHGPLASTSITTYCFWLFHLPSHMHA